MHDSALDKHVVDKHAVDKRALDKRALDKRAVDKHILDIHATEIPLGLYVHFPWCIKKCPYCDFNSHEIEGAIPEARYITRLLEDLETHLSATPAPKDPARVPRGRDLTSIFLGGGTPSLFTPDAIERLLSSIATLLGSDQIEVTLEANPGTLDAHRFAGYRQAGVNRLSLGAQTFDDAALKVLGRIHQSADTLDAFAAARQAGFDNINLDLMHGLPGQSIQAAMSDLEQTFALAPEHLSWYQLSIEKNTHFYRYPPILPEEDRLFDIWQRGISQLAQHGYAQYEVSAFARPGARAVHNLNYWQFGDYLGIGAGAHGKISVPQEPRHATASRTIYRTSKSRVPKDYLQGGKSSVLQIPEAELATEFLMNVLRLNEGFSPYLFEGRTGLPWQNLAAFLAEAESKNLLETTGSNDDLRIRTTATGRRLLDELLQLAP